MRASRVQRGGKQGWEEGVEPGFRKGLASFPGGKGGRGRERGKGEDVHVQYTCQQFQIEQQTQRREVSPSPSSDLQEEQNGGHTRRVSTH